VARCFQRNEVVANDLDLTGHDLGDHFANFASDVRMRKAGNADADATNLSGLNLGEVAGLENRGMQRSARVVFAYTLDLARGTECATEDNRVVANGAVGLAAARINSQEIGHSEVSNIIARLRVLADAQFSRRVSRFPA
jgi:hypothetical protein